MRRCYYRSYRPRFLDVVFLFLISFTVPNSVKAQNLPTLGATWPSSPTNVRANVQVLACLSQFDQWFGDSTPYDRAWVEQGIKNAIVAYNDYAQTDLHFTYAGEAAANDHGCTALGYVPPGYLYVTALETCVDPPCTTSARTNAANGVITSAAIQKYRCMYPANVPCPGETPIWGTPYDWVWTWTHELGHLLETINGNDAFCDAHSVVCYGDESTKLWTYDLNLMRTCDPNPARCIEPYHQTLGKSIIHYRSTNSGVSWTRQYDNLNERTNLPVGIAAGVTSVTNAPYVLSWVSPGDTRVRTAVGDGATWSNKQTVLLSNTQFPPAVSYGGGVWVLAWSWSDDQYDENRRLYWTTSTDGINWALFPSRLEGTLAKGALTGPSLAYDPNSQRFLLSYVFWVNSPQQEDWDRQLRFVVCTSADPRTQAFGNCTALSLPVFHPFLTSSLALNTPAIACRSGTSSCQFIFSEPMGFFENQIYSGCGSVVSGAFQFSSIVPMGDTYQTRWEIGLAASPSTFVLGFRGQNGATNGNTVRWSQSCSALNWTKTIWPSAFPFAPRVAFRPSNGEFALYTGL